MATWTQKTQGFDKYKVDFLIWAKNPRQQRMMCLIKKEIENYVSIIKKDDYKCYICLKIEIPTNLPTFVVWLMLHSSSRF